MMLYIYKILRLNIIAVFITYLIGCLWYFICFLIDSELSEEVINQNEALLYPNGTMGNSTSFKVSTFIDYNGLKNKDVYERLVISCYFALTTLSTVGYGDYYPVSNVERIVAVIIMLGGVAFFSYIMGNFIEIISNYEKKMGAVDKSGDLHNWMVLLTRFTNNPGLKKTITQQIEQNFSYFWAHDRLQCLNHEDNYIESLPTKLKN